MKRGGGAATGEGGTDCEFSLLLDSRHPCEDGELAELIEVDGRARLERGVWCDLNRYRRAVPDLASRPISLDAAIDVCLRSLARRDGTVVPQSHHVEELVGQHPELAGPIRLAGVLGNQLLSTCGMAEIAPHRTTLKLPHSIGQALEDGRPRYELIELLGEGSNGRVYEAVDHLLSDAGHPARVAVKMISVDAATIHMQTAEATKARRIEHPSVARVLDRGLTEDGELYLVYELVTGGDLHSWFEVQGRKIDLRKAAELMSQVARGVQAAHSAGLVHCDLKPSNILVSSTGEPRVTDFGVAAVTGDSADQHDAESASVPIGNLAFAAPEQVRRSISRASPLVDVYALGGLLFYLATGQLPNGTSPSEVVKRHERDRAVGGVGLISDLRPDADDRLDRICARAMRVRPEDRYPTAAEFAGDLDAWLGHRPIAWMNEGKFRKVRLWARRSPVVATLSVLCVVLLVGGSFGSGFYARSAQAATERALDAQWRNYRNGKFNQQVIFALSGEVTENGVKRRSPEEIARMLRAAGESYQVPRPPDWNPENPDN